MASEKSLAIVLRTIDFSETSTVATLFTEDFGKISALAKGARRRKSPFESALDLLALCRIVFLHKQSDALDLLTEAKLERRFRSSATNLSRLYAGYYVAELLRELTDTGDPHPDLFRAADRTLLGLDQGGPVRALVLQFEVTLLQVLGHFPSLDRCAACGRPVRWNKRVAFGLIEGGVLCEPCRPGKRHVVSVSAEALTLLDRCAKTAAGRVGQEDQLDVSGELRGMMNQYIAHLMGRRPRMHAYGRVMFSETPGSR